MPPSTPGTGFRLIGAFEGLFRGQVYRHRDSSLGNFVAAHLYEDLAERNVSPKLTRAVDAGASVLNAGGSTRGVRVRRGDGTFGVLVPSSTPVRIPGFRLLQGMVALTQIGTEVKIIAKSRLKQIDRVINDLVGSAVTLKEKSPNAITVGIAAVNYSESYTGVEGEREFPIDSRPESAVREADDTSGRLERLAASRFDEFLLFKFRATNRPPYPFAWLNERATAADYGAALVRIGALFEHQF